MPDEELLDGVDGIDGDIDSDGDIGRELAALLAELDTVGDRVERSQQPSPPGPPGPPGPDAAPDTARSGAVSGDGPDAAEERAVRGASAALARDQSRAVREELAAIRERARWLAEQARSARAARETARTRAEPRAAPDRGDPGDRDGHRDGHREADVAGGGREQVAVALRTAAAQLGDAGDADEAMVRIVTGALQVITCARWGGLCVQGRGERDQVSVHAASDTLVERLEALQASDGEGPCVDALTGVDTVYVPDLLLERRWPHFAHVATELGVRSVLAVGLPVSYPGGVLNLYSPSPDGFDEPARAVAEVFAEHAAIALAGARRAGQLTRAVQSRDVIGQAKGMIMLQHRVDAERAFRMLVEASQHANLKLVDVARWTIENASAL